MRAFSLRPELRKLFPADHETHSTASDAPNQP